MITVHDKRMSRKDVESIVEEVEIVFKSIEPEAQVIPVGGYRRGKEENQDCDLLLTCPGDTSKMLQALVKELQSTSCHDSFGRKEMYCGHFF
jgi:DNA polymerase/3'-5' exonuclease PolX